MNAVLDRQPVVADLELTAAEVKFYNELGYLPLPGFVRGDAVARLQEELWQVLEAQGLGRERLSRSQGSADRLRQCSQYLAGSGLDALINSERTLSVASRLIGGQAHRYLPFSAVKAGGGGGTFDYHQDNNYTEHDPAIGSINIWVALVDMTPANGCLQVLPGSHKQGQLPSVDVGDGHRKLDIDERELLPIRMRAGDAIAFTRWTVHGSGPNHTDQPRLAYALQYHRADVRWRAAGKDGEPDAWKLLVEDERFNTDPVAQLGPGSE